MKATLDEVVQAYDKLPWDQAFESAKGRIAYQALANQMLEDMGWTRDEFEKALSDRIQAKREAECEGCQLEKLADWMMLNHTCRP